MDESPKSKKRSSTMWNYFTITDIGIASCNTCKDSFSFKTSVSNLRRHLARKHRTIVNEREIRNANITYKNPAKRECVTPDPPTETETEVETITPTECLTPSERLTPPDIKIVPMEPPVIQRRKITSVPSQPLRGGMPLTREDACDTFGKTVSFKLREMEKMQRLLAENLIHQVLFKGVLNQLSQSTIITNAEESNEATVTNHDANIIECQDHPTCNYIKVVTCEEFR